MAETVKKLDHCFYFKGSKLSLDKSTPDEAASKVEFNESDLEFCVTLDRVLFSDLFTVVSKVLTSHSFEPNIENLIACLDSLEFGVNLASSDGQGKYFPAIRFKLPKKNQEKGPILSEFYKEISAYEKALYQAEIDKLNSAKPNELEKENIRLKNQLASATSELSKLRKKVTNLQGHVRSFSNQANSAEVLPAGVRHGVIKEIKPQERTIKVSSGRKSFSFPMQKLESIPAKGSPALVHVSEGQIKNLFPLTEDVEQVTKKIAQVLATDEDKLKLQCQDRKIEMIQAKNNEEEAVIESLKRRDFVILSYYGEHLIKFDPVNPVRFQNHMDIAQEKLMRRYIHLMKKGKSFDI